jgi:hypothetical protein
MAFPRVARVLTKQGTDITALCNRVGDEYGFPPRLIVACGLQESRLDEKSERRGAWPDVSAGLFHQTVKFATGFGLGDGSASEANISTVFHVLKTDRERAADIAGRQLGHWWRQEGQGLEALSRYNSPGLAWANNPNRRNIKDSWDASASHVVADEEEDMARIAELEAALAAEQQWGTALLAEIRRWAERLDEARRDEQWATVRDVAATMRRNADGE